MQSNTLRQRSLHRCQQNSAISNEQNGPIRTCKVARSNVLSKALHLIGKVIFISLTLHSGGFFASRQRANGTSLFNTMAGQMVRSFIKTVDFLSPTTCVESWCWMSSPVTSSPYWELRTAKALRAVTI